MGLNTQFPSWLQDQNQLNAQVGMQLVRNFMEGMKMGEEKRLNEAKMAEMRRMNDVQIQQAQAQIAREKAITEGQVNINNVNALKAQRNAAGYGSIGDLYAMQQDLYKMEGGLSNPDAMVKALEFGRNNPTVVGSDPWNEMMKDFDTANKLQHDINKIKAVYQTGRYDTREQKIATDIADHSGYEKGSPEWNKVYVESLRTYSQIAPTGIVGIAEASIADKFGGPGQPAIGSPEHLKARSVIVNRLSKAGPTPSFDTEFNTIKQSGIDDVEAIKQTLDVMQQHPNTSKKYIGSQYLKERADTFKNSGIQFDVDELKDEVNISTHKTPDTYVKQLIKKDSDLTGLQNAVNAIDKFDATYGKNSFAKYVGPIDSWQNRINALTKAESGGLSEKDQLALNIMQGALIINEPGRKELYGANFIPLEQVRQELQFPSGKNPNYSEVLRNFVNVSKDQLKNELYSVKFKENVPINILKKNLGGQSTPVTQNSPFYPGGEGSRISANQFRYSIPTNQPASTQVGQTNISLPSGWGFK